MGVEPREFKWPFSRIYSFFAKAMDPVYKELAKQISIPSGAQNLLEVGGGDGRLAVILAGNTSLVRIVTTDVSADMVKLAAKRTELNKLSGRIIAEVQNIHNLGYPDNTFDLVISSFSLHHWQDPVKGLKECVRVLKQGGMIAIIDGDRSVSLKDISSAVKNIGGPLGLTLGLWVGRHDLLDYNKVSGIIKETGINWLTVTRNIPLLLIKGTKPRQKE